MSASRPLYLGPRLRRLRRELGLTQQSMAEDLSISPSYIALLERNQRPVTADMLLRLARSYKIDVSDLASGDEEDYVKRIGAVLRDPIFADIDLPALEVADLATSFPGISEAFLRLYDAYGREHDLLAGRDGGAGNPAVADPLAEVRGFLAASGNHFPTLERRAEELVAEFTRSGSMEDWLRGRGVRTRFLPPDVLVESIRRYDRHNEQLLIDETLDAAGRAFQIATHVAHTAMRSQINDLVRAQALSGRTATNLVRRALAAYGAAALRMPYDRFVRAVEIRRYDIEALSRQFGSSFEQVAHRLTTLSRPGEERVRFSFLRLDEAGNVSKRLDGSGFPIAAQGSGSCPLWSVHTAFRRPGEIVSQWLELPDGQRFFSVARTVRAGGGHAGSPPVYRAIALVCSASAAAQLVYADPGDGRSADVTPIGVTCRLCHRARCTARSAPGIGREVMADDNRRSAEPFAFAET